MGDEGRTPSRDQIQETMDTILKLFCADRDYQIPPRNQKNPFLARGRRHKSVYALEKISLRKRELTIHYAHLQHYDLAQKTEDLEGVNWLRLITRLRLWRQQERVRDTWYRNTTHYLDSVDSLWVDHRDFSPSRGVHWTHRESMHSWFATDHRWSTPLWETLARLSTQLGQYYADTAHGQEYVGWEELKTLTLRCSRCRALNGRLWTHCQHCNATLA